MDGDSGLEIRLLGPFDVRIGSSPLPRLRTRKGQHLLAMLAMRAGREVQREWLSASLWPDSDPENGYYNLRRTLADLRGAVGPARELLTAPTPHSLRLDSNGRLSVDVHLFEELARRDDGDSLAGAVALYRGPLLEGWAEEWIQVDREALQQTCFKTMDSLAVRSESCGDWAGAARWLKRLVALDCFQEDAQRRLMEALANNGDFAAATLVYRELRILLRKELNAEPAAETTAAYQRISARAKVSTPPARGDTPPPPHIDRVESLAGAMSALPVQFTSFIGREDERRRIKSLLARNRLVTLIGTGGCGKTRLAIQVASEVESEHRDGVGWLEFAALSDERQVWGAAMAGLGLREESGCPISETVCRALQSKKKLIVLDNCEHLLDGLGRMTADILRACPGIQILATSREALRITGEVTWRVPSLTVPHWQPVEAARMPDLLGLMDYESVRLFADRAAQAEPLYSLTEENAPAVVKVCRRLDGIPLAIELAASRIGTLTTEQIAARLDDRFRLLKWKRRDVLPRQQTLRALIDWSYGLLTEMERVLFRRLAVFAGGFSVEAAEAVCGVEGVQVLRYSRVKDTPPDTVTPEYLNSEEVLELLSRLVDKSLVVFERDSGRYRMLETIRQYARERLGESGEEQWTLDRNLGHFLALSESVDPVQAVGPDRADWLDRLDSDSENVRAALSWGFERGGGVMEGCGWADLCEAGPRMCASLWLFWSLRGYLAEGRQMCQRALDCESLPKELRARVSTGLAFIALNQCDVDSVRHYAKDGLALSREAGDRQSAAFALALLSGSQDGIDAARGLADESVRLAREIGARWIAGLALHSLGAFELYQGNPGLARPRIEESLAISRESGDGFDIACNLELLAVLDTAEGHTEKAQAGFHEAFSLFEARAERRGMAMCLEGLAEVGAQRGQQYHAAQLFGRANMLRSEIGASWNPFEALTHQPTLASLRSSMGEDAFAAAWNDKEGRRRPKSSAP